MAEFPHSTVQSIERAFDILEIMSAAREDVGITEIARLSSLPLPTIHRILRTLIVNGYVYQTPRRRYALGARLIPLSRNADGALGASLRPRLVEIVSQTHESVSVAMLDRDRARYVAHVPSNRSMRLMAEVGHQVDLHATSTGKAIMAMMSDAEVRALLERTGMSANTPDTITDVDTMLRDLHLVRRRGYALDEQENEPGVNCVAVPIRGPIGLAMSVSGPQPRMSRRTVAQMVPILTAAAAAISREICHGQPDEPGPAGGPRRGTAQR